MKPRSNLARVPLAGGAAEVLDNRGTEYARLGGGWLYWSAIPNNSYDPSVIRRVATSGGPIQDVSQERGASVVLAVDGSYSYFTEDTVLGPGVCIKRKLH